MFVYFCKRAARSGVPELAQHDGDELAEQDVHAYDAIAEDRTGRQFAVTRISQKFSSKDHLNRRLPLLQCHTSSTMSICVTQLQ